jgi:hypothetical protein
VGGKKGPEGIGFVGNAHNPTICQGTVYSNRTSCHLLLTSSSSLHAKERVPDSNFNIAGIIT